ncbi:NRAMP (natural resistance-associated macrophage protein) metal ion transporters [Muriicola jejuensis]|uniref:Divalent metal cation transporter n=1 Tax=Muriicola jejuensis TaxID=504488 RepID=A0A6P0UHY2_9FLAO|nr:Nramp family divalent metal transporter [Muriicola jejuensis]NER11399.1 divalent metal cation transporter [Muriicola jejuensis]SMP20992.1 NRAMP (natural resistance-associated macrophage protein) metal ion transporters [Muriicola jejuensis]
MFKKIGPGFLIAAAFIGPGTVTTCTLAGVDFGFALLWALLISIVTTVVFQEMAARIGILTKQGLAASIRSELRRPLVRTLITIIILSAVVLGNAAYEAGNIGGAVLGLEALTGSEPSPWFAWVIGGGVFALLFAGSYKMLEKIFVALVMLMSISFVLAAVLTGPEAGEVFSGLFVPALPEGSLFTVVALIGTTVVPYNLFLHASLVSEKWDSAEDLKAIRWDTILSIGLGGLISIAIVVSASAGGLTEVSSGLDLAKGLEPLYGRASTYFLGIGLFAAGITSAITAPLAAAYVAASCFHWKDGLSGRRFRMVWGAILLTGVLSQFLNFRPIEIIKFAQVANGLLFPVICVLLLWIVNRTTIMGDYKNRIWQNIIAGILLLLIVFLGGKSVLSVIFAT